MGNEEPDTRGPAVVVRGGVSRGYGFVGPFDTVDDATRWVKEETLEGILGVSICEIVLLEEPTTEIKTGKWEPVKFGDTPPADYYGAHQGDSSMQDKGGT